MTENLFSNPEEVRAFNSPVRAEPVEKSPDGVYFFRKPSVALLTRPTTNLQAALPFLESFPESPDEEDSFSNYLSDPAMLTSAERLMKFAGQLCYLSFGKNRTKNADAERYFRNILESGHGSVCEHANFTFLFWGISRSLTHELVRHRAGFAFSQVSQRYVDGGRLRFVMRPEFDGKRNLEETFFEEIQIAYDGYHKVRKEWGDILLSTLSTEKRAELGRAGIRKLQNQVARTFLPNCAEAPIVVTMNARALRHFLNMRASRYAETEIRALALKVFDIVYTEMPNVLQDVKDEPLPDGSCGLHLQFPKV